MKHLISFQTYIEIFNKIEEVNLAALVISSITIVALVINNDFLKVSTRRCHSFASVCMYMHSQVCIHTCMHMCVCHQGSSNWYSALNLIKRKDIKETATYALKKRKVLQDDNTFFFAV